MLLGRYLQLIKTFHVASKNDFILGLLSNVKPCALTNWIKNEGLAS